MRRKRRHSNRMSEDLHKGDFVRTLIPFGVKVYKSDWVVNTLSRDDLTAKLIYCDVELERFQGMIDRKEIHGDYFCAARDHIAWLKAQIKRLNHWMATLDNYEPVEALDD